MDTNTYRNFAIIFGKPKACQMMWRAAHDPRIPPAPRTGLFGR